LKSFRLAPNHIGKEVDRLEADDGATLDGEDPVDYGDEDWQLRQSLAALVKQPQAKVARALGVSERRLRDLLKGRAKLRKSLRQSLLALADEGRPRPQ
jgi:hypothetical protein